MCVPGIWEDLVYDALAATRLVCYVIVTYLSQHVGTWFKRRKQQSCVIGAYKLVHACLIAFSLTVLPLERSYISF